MAKINRRLHNTRTAGINDTFFATWFTQFTAIPNGTYQTRVWSWSYMKPRPIKWHEIASSMERHRALYAARQASVTNKTRTISRRILRAVSMWAAHGSSFASYAMREDFSSHKRHYCCRLKCCFLKWLPVCAKTQNFLQKLNLLSENYKWLWIWFLWQILRHCTMQ